MSIAFLHNPNETFSGDFSAEFLIDSTNFPVPATWGVIPATASFGPGDGAGAAQTKYPGRPYFSVSGANLRPMGNASYQAALAEGDLFSIVRRGTIVKFYKNAHLSITPIPLLEMNYDISEQSKLYAEYSVSIGIAIQPYFHSLEASIGRAFKYTANQQVEDFGSTQSSVKVRVYQESAIVGRGNYIEGMV